MNPPTILCIDNRVVALGVRRAILEMNGYTVLTATNADEGLRLFQSSEIALVISDHLLLGTTGNELARRMKQLNPHVPVILYSGAVRQFEGELYADILLSKTEGPETLLALTGELLNANCQSA